MPVNAPVTKSESSKFEEISAQLAKNLNEVESKKKTMDAAHAALTKAAQEYESALSQGTNLKQQLLDCLNNSYPAELKPKIG